MQLFHDVGAMERPDVRGFRSEASLDGHGPLCIAACAAERRDAATVSQHDGEVGGDAFLSRCARSITLGDETDKDCVAMSRLNLDPFWPREVLRILELPASAATSMPAAGRDTGASERSRGGHGRREPQACHAWQIRTRRGTVGPSRARVQDEVFPCNLRLSSHYGVVNWRTLLFTPSLLPLLSIDVTV